MQPFVPSPEEWKKLAKAARAVARKEYARAAVMDERTAADYIASARTFELLAESCERNVTAN